MGTSMMMMVVTEVEAQIEAAIEEEVAVGVDADME
jgi:hypothetical protein